MIPLPEKGEAARAGNAMDARMRAVVGNVETVTFNLGMADVSRKTGEMETDDSQSIGGVYGDLFDVGETVLMSEPVVLAFIVDIATGRRDPTSAITSAYLQAVGVGVLMERARWTKR